MVFNSLNLYFSRLLSVFLRTGYISLKTLEVRPNLSVGTLYQFPIQELVIWLGSAVTIRMTKQLSNTNFG